MSSYSNHHRNWYNKSLMVYWYMHCDLLNHLRNNIRYQHVYMRLLMMHSSLYHTSPHSMSPQNMYQWTYAPTTNSPNTTRPPTNSPNWYNNHYMYLYTNANRMQSLYHLKSNMNAYKIHCRWMLMLYSEPMYNWLNNNTRCRIYNNRYYNCSVYTNHCRTNQ